MAIDGVGGADFQPPMDAAQTSTETDPGLTGSGTAQPTASTLAGNGQSALSRSLQQDSFQMAAAPREPTLSGREAEAEAARRAEAVRRELASDGQYVGPNGVRPTREAAGAFMPRDGSGRNQPPMIFVNGIMTNTREHAEAAQALADQTGRPVYALRNATAGFARDVGQSGAELAGAMTRPIETLRRDVADAVARGQPIEVHGHSQGAIVVSSALDRVRSDLLRPSANSLGGTTDAHVRQVEDRLRQNVTAYTYGGAAHSYPDGPRYFHRLHNDDVVTNLTGLGSPGSYAGRDAEIIRRTHGGPGIDPHLLRNYMSWAPPSRRQ